MKQKETSNNVHGNSKCMLIQIAPINIISSYCAHRRHRRLKYEHELCDLIFYIPHTRFLPDLFCVCVRANSTERLMYERAANINEYLCM